MRTGRSLANAEGEQNLWAKGNSWKKIFKPQTGVFLEGVPLCPRDIGQGMGGAGPSAGAKESPGMDLEASWFYSGPTLSRWGPWASRFLLFRPASACGRGHAATKVQAGEI